jgi:hypothetical protein
MDTERMQKCREKLIEVAQSKGTIPYGVLAEFLRVANQSVGIYLNPIYESETAAGRPDLTVVVIYPKTGMGLSARPDIGVTARRRPRQGCGCAFCDGLVFGSLSSRKQLVRSRQRLLSFRHGLFCSCTGSAFATLTPATRAHKHHALIRDSSTQERQRQGAARFRGGGWDAAELISQGIPRRLVIPSRG